MPADVQIHTMRFRRRTAVSALLSLLVVGLSGGCCLLTRPVCRTQTRSDGSGSVDAIYAVLYAQQDAWNCGDVEAFMEGYWRSPELTFSSGGEVTAGWQATLDRYHQRYPNRDRMGQLTFSDLRVYPLGRSSAFVLGRWHLDRDEPVGGVFTLVFRRIADRWVIVHDHTSALTP